VQLDLKKLQVFVAVMEQRSFSRAAEICHLSQPTVSGHIKALEEALGITLLDRHTREVVPTRAGLLLYRYAKRIVRLVRDLEQEMTLFKSGGKGKLLLGGSTIPGQYILPRVLGAFKKIHPDVEITLKIADTKEISRLVCEGELELGVVGAKIFEGELVFEPHFRDEIILAVPGHWELPAHISPESLRDIPLIVREKGSGTWLTAKKALREIGVPAEKLHVVAELGSTEAVKQAIKEGIGGAFISRKAVEEELSRDLIREIGIEGLKIERNFYLITQERRTLSPIAQIFIDFFKSYG